MGLLLLWLPIGAAIGMDGVIANPSCMQTLSVDEASKLQSCIARSEVCAKYWPNLSTDLQDCERTSAGIRAALSWPEEFQREVFGDQSAAAPQPAWKKLKRAEIAGPSPQIDLSKTAAADPYAKTSSAITPAAAEAAGINPGIVIGIIQAAGQMQQDRAALENPGAASAAKDILKVAGLENYAASDKAIQDGRERTGQFPDDVQYVNGPGLEVNRFYIPLGCVGFVLRENGRTYDFRNNCRYTVDVYYQNGPYRKDTVYGGLPRAIHLAPGKSPSQMVDPKTLSVPLACLADDSLLMQRAGDLEGVPTFEGHICMKRQLGGGRGGTAQ